MTAEEWDALVVVARVARTHGLRGEVILDSETDFPEERFAPGARVLVNEAGRVRALTLKALRLHKGRPIVGFEGIDAGVTSILWDNHMTPALIFNRLAQLHARGVHLDQQHFPGLS